MILIDTNYLVEIFLTPTDAKSQHRHNRARALLSAIESGNAKAIVSEVVIHECFYVLVMRLQALDAGTFAHAFVSLLSYPGWAMAKQEGDIYRRALAILGSHPKIEFFDAVIAARAEAHNAELATFDQHLASIYDGPTWSSS